jgi:hypothetical protein
LSTLGLPRCFVFLLFRGIIIMRHVLITEWQCSDREDHAEGGGAEHGPALRDTLQGEQVFFLLFMVSGVIFKPSPWGLYFIWGERRDSNPS